MSDLRSCPDCRQTLFGPECSRCAGDPLATRAFHQEGLGVLRPGDTVGAYEIDALVGQGGMGQVYRARQTSLGRIVALKVLPPSAIRSAQIEGRFEREARALAALSHPNIVPIYEFGREEDLAYFAMGFVDGGNLRDALRSGTPSIPWIRKILDQVMDALEHAHSHGIVHRDLKPENILVDAEGRARVADFGLVKLTSGNVPTLTGEVARLGTPGYMAPEQGEHAGRADHRADIYALGALTYEMLTGRVPPGPSSKLSKLEPSWDRAVTRALEAEPERRWASVGEFRRALAPPKPRGSALPVLVGLLLAAAAVGLLFRWSEDRGPRAGIASEIGAFYDARRTLKSSPPVLYRSVALHPDGNSVVAGTSLGGIHRWSIGESGGVVKRVAHESEVYAVAFDPAGKTLASGGQDGLVRLWSADGDRELAGHEGTVRGLAFRPDGSQLASSSTDGSVRIWDVPTGICAVKFECDFLEPRSLSWCRVGLAAATLRGAVLVWDVDDRRILREMPCSGSFSVAFRPDGSLLAVARGPEVELWETKSWTRLSSIPCPGGAGRVAFRPDGRLLAVGTREIRLWDLDAGREVCRLVGHSGTISGLSFSRDGRVLASSSEDATVRLWIARE